MHSKAASRIPLWLPFALAIVGVFLLGYPSISNLYYQLREGQAIEDTTVVIESTSSDALASELALCDDYNNRLRSSKAVLTDPFDESVQRVTEAEYFERLDLAGTGVMATVSIPSIDVSLPLYHTTESAVLQHGLGHVQASSLPSGGTSSHCVVAGHTGLVNMKVLDNLPDVVVGDYIFVQVAGETHAYRVYGVETVLPEETSSMVIQDGRDLMTLVTCVPYGINSHRLLVHAERTDVPDWWNAEAEEQTASSTINFSLLITVLCALAVLALVIVLVCLYVRQRRKTRVMARQAGIATDCDQQMQPATPVRMQQTTSYPSARTQQSTPTAPARAQREAPSVPTRGRHVKK